ncbi:MAG: hypothetical protein RIT14_682 [Pseudomonadota bacterium]|jgi:uncharacterized membrane protein YuzA (DUF378 family)
MRMLTIITLLLIVIGGLNWLAVGLFQIDVVAMLFGGPDAPLSRIVYILVGVSALWQIGPLLRLVSGEPVRLRRDLR